MSEDGRPEPTPKISTRAWSRYGKPPRLYVRVDGVQIGYWDSAKQTAVVAEDSASDAEGHRAVIEAVGSRWQVKHEAQRAVQERPQPTAMAPPVAPPSASAAPSAASARPEPPKPSDRGRDLSLIKAGETVGAVARAKFREAPLRNAVRRLLRRRDREDWSWEQGERGEKTVGRVLERAVEARRGWFMLHGITRDAKGTDIDHLLIGPGGIFTINTKHHAGKRVWVGEHTLKVGSASTKHLFRARDEAAAVTAVLRAACQTPRSVTPVIVVVGASSLQRATRSVDDVVVLEPGDIRAWLDGLDDVLRRWEIEQFYDAARWESTWLPQQGRSS